MALLKPSRHTYKTKRHHERHSILQLPLNCMAFFINVGYKHASNVS